MSYESFIALRYLSAKKKSFISVITFISVLGICLGVTALTVVLSVTGGFQDIFREKVLGLNAHVLVMKYGLEFTEYPQVVDRANKVEGVEGASPFIFHEMMLSAGANMTGIMLKGVDPATLSQVSDLESYMIAGQTSALQRYHPDQEPGPARLPGVIIGKELATKMGAGVGDPVTLVSPLQGMSPDNWGQRSLSPTSSIFRVVGVYSSGFSEFDSKLAYANMYDVQKFFNQGDTATGIEIKVADIFKSEETSALVKGALGDNNYTISTWQELHPELAQEYLTHRKAATLLAGVSALVFTGTFLGLLGFFLWLGAQRRARRRGVVTLGEILAAPKGCGGVDGDSYRNGPPEQDAGKRRRSNLSRLRPALIMGLILLVSGLCLSKSLKHSGLLGTHPHITGEHTLNGTVVGNHLLVRKDGQPYLEYRSTVLEASRLDHLVADAGPVIEGAALVEAEHGQRDLAPGENGTAPDTRENHASQEAREGGKPVLIHGYTSQMQGAGPSSFIVAGSGDDLTPDFSFFYGAQEAPAGVLLGADLARSLGVTVGDHLTLRPQGPTMIPVEEDGQVHHRPIPGPDRWDTVKNTDTAGRVSVPANGPPPQGTPAPGAGTGLAGPLMGVHHALIPYPPRHRVKVAGLIQTGDTQMDGSTVFMDFVPARRILSLTDGAGAVAVQLNDPAHAGLVRPILASRLGGHAYRTLDWKELNKNLFASLEMQKTMLSLIFFVIILVASFNIISTLILLILDKGRDIAILKSMGATSGGITKIFMLQGTTIGFIGIMAGLVTGLLICLAIGGINWPLDPTIYLIDKLPVAIKASDFLMVAVVSLAISVGATILPSRTAGGKSPVDGLR